MKRSLSRLLGGLAATWMLAAPALGGQAAPAVPITVTVRVSGSVPGTDRADLERFCVERMTALGLAGWRFEPATDDSAPAANSIDFHFVRNPYGGGTNRYIGPVRSTKDDLFGLHRSISVEARLFLDGQYETLSFGQGQVRGGTHDPDVGTLVARLTHALIVSADTIGSLSSGPIPTINKAG